MSAPSSLSLLDLYQEDLARLQRLFAEGYRIGEASGAHRHCVIVAQDDIIAVDGVEPGHHLSGPLVHRGVAWEDTVRSSEGSPG